MRVKGRWYYLNTAPSTPPSGVGVAVGDGARSMRRIARRSLFERSAPHPANTFIGTAGSFLQGRRIVRNATARNV